MVGRILKITLLRSTSLVIQTNANLHCVFVGQLPLKYSSKGRSKRVNRAKMATALIKGFHWKELYYDFTGPLEDVGASLYFKLRDRFQQNYCSVCVSRQVGNGLNFTRKAYKSEIAVSCLLVWCRSKGKLLLFWNCISGQKVQRYLLWTIFESYE